MDGEALIGWGDGILHWAPGLPRPAVLFARPGVSFSAGGCLADVDGDGNSELIVCQRDPQPALVWFDRSRWARHSIEPGVVAEDIAPAVLSGRPGVLVIHRHAQLRFYQIPQNPRGEWPVRDLYSFYTPSDQGGLLTGEVDRDGTPDMFCGNYWLRAPARFELPWRLFAINAWTEEKRSGMCRLARVGDDLAACQSAVAPARVALFERPAAPAQLWKEHRLEGSLALDAPRVLLARDFAGGGRTDLLACESRGAGRFILFKNRGGRKFQPEIVQSGAPMVFAGFAPDGALLGAGPAGFARWEMGT